ncbi:MAG: hypothetical protein EG825_15275 [Rhodocyclaceae bacterium]|nr:hypothetical protein [Rhodocyclaceae bacterium]
MAQAELPLDPTTIALVSLAANIAANHPKKGLCQIERLRGYGIRDEQIDMVVDIARHLRNEAGEMLDAAFNEEAGLKPDAAPCCASAAESAAPACCTPTAKGNPCC